MSFQPVVPFGGFAGWSFLQRTREAQQEAFDRSPRLQRDVDAFAARIGEVKTAEDLVNDRQLLSVALGAFGLDDDIGNTFFIRKVLEDGTLNQDALANKLSDKRYLAFSEAFGFDLSPPRTVLSTFSDEIVSLYRERQFEVAIGNSEPDMRLAMTLERELPALAERSLTEDGRWFTIMATPPLRAVFERAFNLPTAIGTLDIDRQLTLFKERAAAAFGNENVSQFADPEKREELTRRFLASADGLSLATSNVRGSAALAILQASQSGPGIGLRL